MKFSLYALASASILFASSSQAQLAAAPAGVAPAPILAGAADANVLRAGTSVPLTMAEPLTTKGKNLKVGQRFQLQTAAPVTVNGVTVIPVGSPATGEITEVRNKGMWGKSGRINARVLYVRANGRQIRLSGQLDDKGTTGTAGVVGAVALLPVAGFFMTGTSANIPLGAPVTAFVDEDVAVAFGGIAPVPMAIPASAAAAPLPAASAPLRSMPVAAGKAEPK
jgi:hypothetical protein